MKVSILDAYNKYYCPGRKDFKMWKKKLSMWYNLILVLNYFWWKPEIINIALPRQKFKTTYKAKRTGILKEKKKKKRTQQGTMDCVLVREKKAIGSVAKGG